MFCSWLFIGCQCLIRDQQWSWAPENAVISSSWNPFMTSLVPTKHQLWSNGMHWLDAIQLGIYKAKEKKGCFKAFLNASSIVLAALNGLGEGAEPSDSVVEGCEEFLCSLFCPKQLHIPKAKNLRWYLFKRLRSDQGVDMLPPTHGAWLEHIRRAHIQASVWSQDLVLNPVIPNPLMLGWQMQHDKLMPLLSKEAPAPEAVLQLIRCNCGSTNIDSANKCSRRCSCRQNNIVCTELCNCTGDDTCQNTNPITDGQDIEEDWRRGHLWL